MLDATTCLPVPLACCYRLLATTCCTWYHLIAATACLLLGFVCYYLILTATACYQIPCARASTSFLLSLVCWRRLCRYALLAGTACFLPPLLLLLLACCYLLRMQPLACKVQFTIVRPCWVDRKTRITWPFCMQSSWHFNRLHVKMCFIYLKIGILGARESS